MPYSIVDWAKFMIIMVIRFCQWLYLVFKTAGRFKEIAEPFATWGNVEKKRGPAWESCKTDDFISLIMHACSPDDSAVFGTNCVYLKGMRSP